MAHSTDLRERIINAVIHKRYTLQKAADTFDVGAATVSRYLRRYRQTGNLTPRTSPGRPSALVDHQAWVEQSLIATTSPTTSAATCCSTKLASASAEPPCAAGYRDWDRREKKTIYAGEQGPEARCGTWLGSGVSTRTGRCSWMRAASTSPRPRPTPTPPGTTCRGEVPKSRGENTSLVAAISLDEGVSDAMTSTGAVAGVAF